MHKCVETVRKREMRFVTKELTTGVEKDAAHCALGNQVGHATQLVQVNVKQAKGPKP